MDEIEKMKIEDAKILENPGIEFRNKLKDIFYPLFRKSRFFTCIADNVGINTVTKKNKKKKEKSPWQSD